MRSLAGRAIVGLCAVLIGSGAFETARAGSSDLYDLVISNGRVVDPESQLDGNREVGIRAGRIAALSRRTLRGKRMIDARGLIVAPGFIDMHAHGQQLPAARMQAFDGVTTALEMEGGVLPVQRFYERAATEGRPINYGASVSWAAARYAAFNGLTASQTPTDLEALFKSDSWVHDIASPQQTERILSDLEQGLREGGLGIGILLAYAPGSGHKEYFAVNELAARYGVTTVTHVRSASVLEPASSFEAYQEVIATAAATGAHMHIAHLNSSSLRDIELSSRIIAKAQQRGLPITVEAYPYSAASTLIGSAFFRGPQWRERLGGLRYDDFELNGAALDESRFLELQKSHPDTLVVFQYLRSDEQALLDESILFPGGAIASDGLPWSDGRLRLEGDVWPLPEHAYAHPRSAGTFSRFLRVYVRERRKLTYLQAIEKITLIPARILESSVPQMRDKGRIRIGADADLVIFDPEQITDRATFEKPASPSFGMHYVIVGGTPVIADQQLVRAALPGRPVRRAPRSQ